MSDIETAAKYESLEVDPRLLEALVCPVSRRPLTFDKAAQELISPTVGLAFPIRSGVPIMLVDQARKFDPVKP